MRIDSTVTSGKFRLDGGEWDVDNNVYVVGDDSNVYVVDPSHDLDAVAELVGDRHVEGILLTHAHDDHVRMAPELAMALEAPLLLNPADREVWQLTHGDLPWDDDVADGDVFSVGGTDIEALHTPGHMGSHLAFRLGEAVFCGDLVMGWSTTLISPGSI
mgnify:CR=1 FL=1